MLPFAEILAIGVFVGQYALLNKKLQRRNAKDMFEVFLSVKKNQQSLSQMFVYQRI